MKRHKMSSGKSYKLFKKTANHTKGVNMRASPMRGGFRL